MTEIISSIDLKLIKANPFQPRQTIDPTSLNELVNSIKEHGILQPLIVSPVPGGYELIAGERRFRAATAAGLKEVPVVVREASTEQKLELALVENIQRKDLNPLEAAQGYRRLIQEFNLTQSEAAEKVGKSRESVANTLRLLSLPDEVKKAILDNKISEGHAKAILALDSASLQLKLLDKILKEGLTVRTTEALARVSKKGGSKSGSKDDPNLELKINQLREALGTKIQIQKNGQQGKITVEFYSDEELNNIIDKIID